MGFWTRSEIKKVWKYAWTGCDGWMYFYIYLYTHENTYIHTFTNNFLIINIFLLSCFYRLGKLPKNRFKTKVTDAVSVEGVKDIQYKRYYHLFKEFELEYLVDQKIGTVIDFDYDKDNWWCIVKKLWIKV